MKNTIKKILLVLLSFLLVCFCSISIADVGNFESYDSDWGSSSWDSDWGSSSWDSDYGYYGDSSDGGSVLLGIIIIIFIIWLSTKKNKVTNTTSSGTNYSAPIPSQSNVLESIKKVDQFFNEEKFLANAKNVFVKLQEAWTKRDWELIRPMESEDLFEQHSKQLKQYIEKKQINVMDRIAVNYAKLHSFTQDDDKDVLKVILNSSMVDYIMEEETGKVVMGDKTTRRTRTYLMTFIRKKGVVTAESNDAKKTTNCPNCGAPTTITSSGKCEYCGSVITTGEHDWVLSNLEPYR